jgi:alpha-glucosidase
MAADLIEHYQQNLPAFQFILDVPTDWKESIAVAGEVGDYSVIVRQQKDSDDWFLGAITDENARSVVVPLTFLESGKVYEAQMYRDGENANWQTNPYELKIEQRDVTSKDSLKLNMATSGGAAIRFKAK